MKKIKLLTSLGAITALGGGVALSTSCSSTGGGGGDEKEAEKNGSKQYTGSDGYTELYNFATNANFKKSSFQKITINQKTSGWQTVAQTFIEDNLTAGVLADGVAASMIPSDETKADFKKFNITWSTATDGKITVEAKLMMSQSSSVNGGGDSLWETFTAEKNNEGKYTKFTYIDKDYDTGEENVNAEATIDQIETVEAGDIADNEEGKQYIDFTLSDDENGSSGVNLYVSNIDFDNKIEVIDIHG